MPRPSSSSSFDEDIAERRVPQDGRIELTVGAETRQLGPGDAYYFTSAIPHRFRNTGAEPCEIISANTPPTF